jgi:EpsG-like putative glucosyltransferase
VRALLFYLAVYLIIVIMRLAMGEYARTNPGIYRVIMLALFLISAFRFEVGCDWGGYIAQLDEERVQGIGKTLANREWLWFLFLHAVARLGVDYAWVNVVSAAAFFAGVHVLAKRQLDPVGFLVLLFPILVMNLPMSGIRQGVAVGLMCVAFTAFIDRRVIKFVIWTAIAGSIHSSAIIFFLLVPFCLKLRPGVQMLTAFILALPGLYLLLTGSAADVAFSRYVQSDIEAAGANYRVALVFVTGLVFLFYLRRPWQHFYPYDFPLMLIGGFMMVGTGALLLLSSVIADRMGYYLVPLQAAMLARIPYLPIRSGRPLYFITPYAIFLAVFVGWMSFSSLFRDCYVPYKTWLFGGHASEESEI